MPRNGSVPRLGQPPFYVNVRRVVWSLRICAYVYVWRACGSALLLLPVGGGGGRKLTWACRVRRVGPVRSSELRSGSALAIVAERRWEKVERILNRFFVGICNAQESAAHWHDLPISKLV